MVQWLERRGGVLMVLAVLASAIPLLAPPLPPLGDLPGHIGRYAVQINIAHDPLLQRFYSYDWALVPNLGVELLIVPVSKLFGIELGVKLIVIAAVMATVAGFIAVGRQAQGKWPVAILFALPIAYNFPFQFGFINYYLSMALALLVFAWWMRLGGQGRIGLRAALAQPLTFLVWLCHIGGWGALGLFAFAAEFTRHRGAGFGWFASAWRGAFHCLPLATPMLLMIFRQVGAAGSTGNFFDGDLKIQYVLMAVSDRWRELDTLSVILLLAVIAVAPILRIARIDRTLGLAAFLLFAAFVFTPSIVAGSVYADMRLAPYVIAMALLAIELRADAGRRATLVLMGAGAVFFAARTAATTISFARSSAEIEAELGALDHIPRGARIVALVHRACETPWMLERKTHLVSLAIGRRSAFVNDQFVVENQQLLGVHYPAAGRFYRDDSEMVVADDCVRPDWPRLSDALREVPRDAFDYIWLIDAPQSRLADFGGLTPVWRNGRSTLFRIERVSPRATASRARARK